MRTRQQSVVGAGVDGPRRLGRPRSSTVDDAILDAAIALIAERGLHDASTDAIAARAHVGKDTMYRRWPHKEQLVAAALERLDVDRPPLPDTGSLSADLEAYLGGLAERIAGSALGPILAAAVGEAPHAPALRAWACDHGDRVRADVIMLLSRGRRRGEIDRGIAIDTLVTLLVSPSYADWLLTGRAAARGDRSAAIAAVLQLCGGTAGLPS